MESILGFIISVAQAIENNNITIIGVGVINFRGL